MLHGWEHLSEDEREVIARGVRDNTVYSGPFHAEFSPTDACNYTCFFCNSAFVDRSKRIKWETLERTFRDLIAMGLKSLRLSGGGEPLIYPEVDQILDMCIENKIALSNLTTNFFRVNDTIADRLLKLDAPEIIVSFNDIDPALYATTNGTNERAFHVVRENLRDFIIERNRRGLTQPKITQQFFIWKANHERIEEAYDMALELDVDHIYIRDLWGIDAEKRMTPGEIQTANRNLQRLVERDKGVGKLILGFSNEALEADLGATAQDQVERTLAADADSTSDDERNEYCYIGWYSTTIRGNGEVFPCCMLATTEGYPPLGNIHDQSIGEIWRGENYQTLRSELRQIALEEGRYSQSEKHCFALEFCAMREACPFVKSLATPEFYAQVDGQLETLRRRPAERLRKLARAMTENRPFIGSK